MPVNLIADILDAYPPCLGPFRSTLRVRFSKSGFLYAYLNYSPIFVIWPSVHAADELSLWVFMQRSLADTPKPRGRNEVELLWHLPGPRDAHSMDRVRGALAVTHYLPNVTHPTLNSKNKVILITLCLRVRLAHYSSCRCA